MCASFAEALMDHVMEAAMIPKVQLERAVGPILSMFLEDVLAETLRDDPALSEPLAMICPEFPLKKPGNRQSTNIDWLIYNAERRQILFVELKTSDTSVDADQNAIYHTKQEAIRNEVRLQRNGAPSEAICARSMTRPGAREITDPRLNRRSTWP